MGLSLHMVILSEDGNAVEVEGFDPYLTNISIKNIISNNHQYLTKTGLYPFDFRAFGSFAQGEHLL